MSLSLLVNDPRLMFIVVLAGVVSLLTTLNVAARPAAVQTGRVALAFTISSLFFMVTRFANLFYLPLLGAYVDKATPGGQPDPVAFDRLYQQIQWVVMGAGVGALLAWILLPTLVEVYRRGIRSMEHRQSMVRVLARMMSMGGWESLMGSLRRPSTMGVGFMRLGRVPWDFLLMNVLATAVWTVGALCALLASAKVPAFATTAVLLSGLVNAVAAISFTIWVDPKAALITDQAIAGERPQSDVAVTAVHLAAGNFLGAMLGLLVLMPGTRVIEWAAVAIGSEGEGLAGSLILVVLINLVVYLLASSNVAARVSAVATGRVATALAVYNVFFLITRLANQVYAPILGSIRDFAVDNQNIAYLGPVFRIIILGGTAGVLVGWLLLPTFVEVYNRAVLELDRRGSVPALVLAALSPRSWASILRCLRPPSLLLGVTWSDYRMLPQAFLWGNVIVVAVHTVGVKASILASAQVSDLARTATLLSSVVNGVATIMLSVVVDPTAALITDECVAKKRPERHINAMAVFLIAGTLLGTLLSQAIFDGSAWVIVQSARLMGGTRTTHTVTLTAEASKLYRAYDLETKTTRWVASPKRVGDVGVLARADGTCELVGRGGLKVALPHEGPLALPLSDGRTAAVRVLRVVVVPTETGRKRASVTLEWRIEGNLHR